MGMITEFSKYMEVKTKEKDQGTSSFEVSDRRAFHNRMEFEDV